MTLNGTKLPVISDHLVIEGLGPTQLTLNGDFEEARRVFERSRVLQREADSFWIFSPEAHFWMARIALESSTTSAFIISFPGDS